MHAISTADVAVPAKLHAEAIENAERKQVEGVTSAGRARGPEIRCGVLAHAISVVERNSRSAAILGVVGAGGIGLQIAERIRVRHWDEVAFIIILMIVTVSLIDWISGRIRRKLIGAADGRVR